ncbi:MAG: zinc ribbon domain-containing protein [Lachnospiraceae bacterium]|nr:zinc ribbon domain-containing protein [Lachnospiraceae bacterium]
MTEKHTSICSLILKTFLSLVLMLAIVILLPIRIHAKDLDEILNYTIWVDVNEDATLYMRYHIKWKVLDSESEGPLTWVKIGIPNQHCTDIKANSDCIKKIAYSGNGGSYIRIDLDRPYKAGETVSLDFSFTQDYMYQMNMETEGETVYRFTPGWFDEINVDMLSIYWKNDKVLRATEGYDDLPMGYLLWMASVPKGDKVTIDVVYPNDAFGFDTSKEIKQSKNKNTVFNDPTCVAFIVIAAMGLVIYLLYYLYHLIRWRFSSGFKGSSKKTVRTILEMYAKCPNCGAERVAGKESCEYCGTNLIKKKTKVIEEKVPKKYSEYKDEILKRKRKGTYSLSSSPDTYVRITSVTVPHSTTFHSYMSTHLASRGAGGRSGSCFSGGCACACACACAGGGRAGCSAKDFYRTNVKLNYFKKKLI